MYMSDERRSVTIDPFSGSHAKVVNAFKHFSTDRTNRGDRNKKTATGNNNDRTII